MAVAAHVSRVAKDYAPHGYSIMEVSSKEATSESSGTDDSSAFMFYAGDCDVYIEEISWIGDSTTNGDDTNYLTVSVLSFLSGGTSEVVHGSITTKTTGSGGTGNIAEDTVYNIPVSLPVVSSSRVVALMIEKSTAHGNTNDKTVFLSVRYRRKA